MHSTATLLSAGETYEVQYAPPASQVLAAAPPEVRMAIRRRLVEIAHIAGTLAPWMPDEVRSTLHFEIAGYAVSYVISDNRRSLMVLGLVKMDR